MLLVAEQVRVEAAQVGLLPVPLLLRAVKSSLGGAWLAARALPRHAIQVGAKALVSTTSSFPAFLFSGRDHWPPPP
jgi:hypothetical protein